MPAVAVMVLSFCEEQQQEKRGKERGNEGKDILRLVETSQCQEYVCACIQYDWHVCRGTLALMNTCSHGV